MSTDLHAFFKAYTDSFNQALGEAPNYEHIQSYFTPSFLAAGPHGVRCSTNDKGLLEVLRQGYGFYCAIGTREVRLLKVAVTPIDERHQMAKVFFQADFQKRSGEGLSIDFDVTYLVQFSDGQPQIFVFIGGDEMALFCRHGLIGAEDQPG